MRLETTILVYRGGGSLHGALPATTVYCYFHCYMATPRCGSNGFRGLREDPTCKLR